MDHMNSTIITPNRERGQHLRFEDRCTIKLCSKLGFSLRKIGGILDCAASTVSNAFLDQVYSNGKEQVV